MWPTSFPRQFEGKGEAAQLKLKGHNEQDWKNPFSNFTQSWELELSFFLTRSGTSYWTWDKLDMFPALKFTALLGIESLPFVFVPWNFCRTFFFFYSSEDFFFSVANKCDFDQIREIFTNHANQSKISRSRKWSIISDTDFDCEAKSDANIKSLL